MLAQCLLSSLRCKGGIKLTQSSFLALYSKMANMMGALVPPENLVVGKQYIMVNVIGGVRFIIEFRGLYCYGGVVGAICVSHAPIYHVRDKNGEWIEEPQYEEDSRRASFGIFTKHAQFYEIE